MSQLQCNSTAAALSNQIYFAADKSHNNRVHTLQEPYSCPPVINIPPCSALISLVPRPHVYELLAIYQAVIGSLEFACSTMELSMMHFKQNLASVFRCGFHFISSSSPPSATGWHALSHNNPLQRSSNYYVIPRLVFWHQYRNMTGGCQLNHQQLMPM